MTTNTPENNKGLRESDKRKPTGLYYLQQSRNRPMVPGLTLTLTTQSHEGKNGSCRGYSQNKGNSKCIHIARRWED